MNFVRAVKLVLTLNCAQSARLVSDGYDRKLSRSERIALRAHLLVCTACRKLRRQLELVHLAAQADSAPGGRLSPQQRARIAERIEGSQSGGPRSD